MPQYQIGDPVEVDVTHLQQTPGSGAMVSDAPDPTTQWTAAIVEDIRTTPGSAGYERYQIRLTGDVLTGEVTEVSVETLRPPAD